MKRYPRGAWWELLMGSMLGMLGAYALEKRLRALGARL